MTITVLVVAYALLWLVAKPSGVSTASFVGQWFGGESILLMSIALVLISTLPWVETWFHGIDRAAIWHRRAAITGTLLLVPHVLLASNRDSSTLGPPLAVIGMVGLILLAVWSVLPRWRDMTPASLRDPILAVRHTAIGAGLRWVFDGYERWRTVHRTTGIFVAAGFVHGILDETAFDGAPVLRWSYVGIGGIGLAFYVYRELIARHLAPFHDYQVESAKPVGEGLVEISLVPLGQPLTFVPGQFVSLYLESKEGWQRHPFTITSAPPEPRLRFTVRALGDFTSQLQSTLEPGMPAVVGRPHGRFDYRHGTDHQAWIGAGAGVAPFLSWLRSLDADFARHVDFFYTSRGEAPFADEILAIAGRYPSLHVHLVDTSTGDHLTPARVLAAAAAPPRELSVYMCGPSRMLRQFESAFRPAGVPRSQIHREFFNLR